MKVMVISLFAVVTRAGGTGKTRMAVQLCDNFRKGVGIPVFAVD